ncbi:hypothetical protein VN12_23195 [Pirellula sp. SH-Sr6A]|nr:hypothetical protein VN12_23195 [Pirellula sp. SH-Sr6A]
MNRTDKGLLLILHNGGRGGWRQIVRQACALGSEVRRDQMTSDRRVDCQNGWNGVCIAQSHLGDTRLQSSVKRCRLVSHDR